MDRDNSGSKVTSKVAIPVTQVRNGGDGANWINFLNVVSNLSNRLVMQGVGEEEKDTQ